MESVVPPQITAELTQILSNLVLGDNEIRARYCIISSLEPNVLLNIALVRKKQSMND
jgi:hypothetical protein